MSNIFNVGDKVLIRKDSSYYTTNPYNPKDVEGEIYRIAGDGEVEFDIKGDDHKLLGEILVEMGYMESSDVKAVLKIMGEAT